jgi:type II secretory pathway component PulJ
MKKSILLLELIISIILISIISLISLNFTFYLYKQNNRNLNLNMAKIDLESTKLFLQKNNLAMISFNQNKLLYNNHLLLDNITKYKLSNENNLTFIDICIKKKYEICTNWILK